MTLPQLAVTGDKVYQLLGDGTLLRLENGPPSSAWKVLDNDTGNIQITAADEVLVRRKSGGLYRYNGKAMDKILDEVEQAWAWGAEYYARKSNSSIIFHRDAKSGTWSAITEDNKLFTALAFAQSSLYQLHSDGKIYQLPKDQTAGTPKWQLFDSNPQTLQIVGGATLYKRHKNGQVFSWDSTKWTLLGNDLRTVQIAAGDGGLLQRLNNGSIYKHVDGKTWESADPSSDNTDVVVGKLAYRITSQGKAFKLIDNINTWEALPDASVRTKDEGKPNEENKPNQNGKPNQGDGHNGDDASCLPVTPEEFYTAGNAADSPTLLRIGNGGAGQVGFLRHIAEAFVKDRVAKGAPPFKVAWYKSDTTETIRYLKDGIVDVGITYTPAAEQLAINQGIAAKPSYYIFREHFLLVGPPSNPAKLDTSMDIDEMFSLIYTAAEAGNTKPLVRFLSRYDKSATNIKDSELWIRIGQVPWATKYSNWYHQYMAYPIQAMNAAAALEEYTLTDWGTYLSVDAAVTAKLKIYKKGGDSTYDPLLMPAHALLGTKAKNAEMAKAFVEWLVSNAGQAVVASFQKNNEQVYSAAPKF